ncbi:hypothetical protein [Simkania negevensis]|uniref:Uncharacterized protein n=1 Tax=Simkania negevensis (strain ATCC VR-1471 / DSM 27360 / Z) TaxID=331113 RepID=F8L2Z4_SIMNZ|nr:hypothetical protein [Simkania negevensis]CCB87840.1 unknown protein [Simkania negevensis Z]
MKKTPAILPLMNQKRVLSKKLKKLKYFFWVALFFVANCAYADSAQKYINKRADMKITASTIREMVFSYYRSFWFGENMPYTLMVVVGMLLSVIYLLWEDAKRNKKKAILIVILAMALTSVWPIGHLISGIDEAGR